MKKMHELIDEDDPHCPYCGAKCYRCGSGSYVPVGRTLYHDSYLCHSCREFFTNNYYHNDGKNNYVGCDFTCCFQYMISFVYAEDIFQLQNVGNVGKIIATIPAFAVDFSDKQKLLNNLETYILFC